ncbi:hypothetical protein [Daejeonella lutea]|uniref:Lipoprotein n=1 Tax=Daejeonella lutea TaxID=572036 RepID=A0A1T5F6G1_9SPHI|nr:hypothetical protein [Daejeonella lutea]SKB91757.1 hypothetical protein SAMN05661099_3454 [Daejeonella lutea]
MKKVLLTVAVLGTIFFTGCEKDEALVPAEKTLLKADKGILCRGCGDWDIVDPEATSLRTATYDGATDTVAAPAKPGKPVRKK